MTESFFYGLVTGITLSWIAVSIANYYATKRVSSIIDDVTSEVMSRVIQVRAERYNEEWYFYNTQDDSFVAKGATVDDLRKTLDERYPDHMVVVTDGLEDDINELKKQS